MLILDVLGFYNPNIFNVLPISVTNMNRLEVPIQKNDTDSSTKNLYSLIVCEGFVLQNITSLYHNTC